MTGAHIFWQEEAAAIARSLTCSMIERGCRLESTVEEGPIHPPSRLSGVVGVQGEAARAFLLLALQEAEVGFSAVQT